MPFLASSRAVWTVSTSSVQEIGHSSRHCIPRLVEAHHYDIAPDGREIAFTFDPQEDKRFGDVPVVVEREIDARAPGMTSRRRVRARPA